MLAYNLTTPPPVAAMFLRAPVRMPSPRQLVEAEASRLIDVLDAMEPDADLEDGDANEAIGDDEPDLAGSDTDRELDTSDFEPSLGSVGSTFARTTRFAMTVNGRTYNPADQTRWASGALNDREEDAGDDREEENEHGGDVQDEPHDPESDEDKGAEEDDGPLHYGDGDGGRAAAARGAREQLRTIQDRRRRAPRGNLRMVTITGPDGGAYVVRSV